MKKKTTYNKKPNKYNKKTKKNKQVKFKNTQKKIIKGGSCCMYEDIGSKNCWDKDRDSGGEKQDLKNDFTLICEFAHNSTNHYIILRNHAYKHMDEVPGCGCTYDVEPSIFRIWICNNFPRSIVYETSNVSSRNEFNVSFKTLTDRIDEGNYFKQGVTYIGFVDINEKHVDTNGITSSKCICVVFKYHISWDCFDIFAIVPRLFSKIKSNLYLFDNYELYKTNYEKKNKRVIRNRIKSGPPPEELKSTEPPEA